MHISPGAQAQKVTLFEQGGQSRSRPSKPDRTTGQYHVRQTRMGAQFPGGFAVIGNSTLGVEHVQPLQQGHRLLPMGCRRLINPGNSGGIPGPPLGELQDQGRQIGLQNFRRGIVRQSELFRFAPQAITDARLNPAGPALALFRRGFRDPTGHQPGHAAVGVKHSPALLTAVDNNPNAFNGKTGFGNSRGQHHLALALRRGRYSLILLLGFQVAVQRCNHDLIRQVVAELLLNPTDFTGAGQEHQQGACLIPQCFLNHRRNLIYHPTIAWQRPIVNIHRECPPLTGDYRDVSKHLRNGCRIQGCRHHQQPQILPQGLLGLPDKRKAKIRLKGAFMEFIKDDRGIILQHRIGLDQPGQDALGHHFNAGGAGNPGVQPGAITHGLTGLLVQLPGHEPGCRSSRQAAGFQHQDLAVTAPGRIQKGEGNTGSFAGTRRGLQEYGTGLLQSRLQLWKNGVDREHRVPGFQGLRSLPGHDWPSPTGRSARRPRPGYADYGVAASQQQVRHRGSAARSGRCDPPTARRPPPGAQTPR